jgi:metal-dependent amidase/aminoacylase/carboxypeptidase family protein
VNEEFDSLPPYAQHAPCSAPEKQGSRDVTAFLQQAIDELSSELRELSLKIISHPELSWEEKQASKWAADFMHKHGFQVVHPAYELDTAFEAVFEYKSTDSSPCVGFVRSRPT